MYFIFLGKNYFANVELCILVWELGNEPIAKQQDPRCRYHPHRIVEDCTTHNYHSLVPEYLWNEHMATGLETVFIPLPKKDDSNIAPITT